MNRLIKIPVELALVFAALSLNISCQHTSSQMDSGRQPAQVYQEKSLLEVFDSARQLYKQANNKKKNDLDAIGESKIIDILIKENLLRTPTSPEKLAQGVLSHSKKKTDPQEITLLPSLNAQGGYYDVNITVSHPYYRGNKLIAAEISVKHGEILFLQRKNSSF